MNYNLFSVVKDLAAIVCLLVIMYGVMAFGYGMGW
jgi:hypothetical protein